MFGNVPSDSSPQAYLRPPKSGDDVTRAFAAVKKWPKAVVLLTGSAAAKQQKIYEFLDAWGIECEAFLPHELSNTIDPDQRHKKNSFCVLSSAAALNVLVQQATKDGSSGLAWLAQAASVYVFDFGDDGPSRELLRHLTGDSQASVRGVRGAQIAVSITDNYRDLCGPLSGIGLLANMTENDRVFDIRPGGDGFRNIFRSEQGAFFFSVRSQGVDFFVNSCSEVIDIHAPCTINFDIRKQFCSLVPLSMYLKWAFRDGQPIADSSACVIVDDPPLKRKYGFLDYRVALGLMDRYNFTTSIAFIPWNWERTDPDIVSLFHRRPDRFSISVHGCDHTCQEFAEASSSVLQRKIHTANERMLRLSKFTSLRYDAVMLYPQGAFSASAGRALKLNGFAAVVNTEVAPVNRQENQTTMADLLGLAIMKYGTFAMFTRRYMAQGVENFAFDMLLGKPCLIAAHHDDFARGARDLTSIVDKLNALKCRIRWCSLGETVSHTFSSWTAGENRRMIKMFSERLKVANTAQSLSETTFLKEEGDPDSVTGVLVNNIPSDFRFQDGVLRFDATLPASGTVEVQVTHADRSRSDDSIEPVKYRMKIALRRYLSEFRDNYLSRNPALQQRARKMKLALKW